MSDTSSRPFAGHDKYGRLLRGGQTLEAFISEVLEKALVKKHLDQLASSNDRAVETLLEILDELRRMNRQLAVLAGQPEEAADDLGD